MRLRGSQALTGGDSNACAATWPGRPWRKGACAFSMPTIFPSLSNLRTPLAGAAPLRADTLADTALPVDQQVKPAKHMQVDCQLAWSRTASTGSATRSGLEFSLEQTALFSFWFDG